MMQIIFCSKKNTCPLGSGALAGNLLEIDRKELAANLEFENVTENSMHAAGDQNYVG